VPAISIPDGCLPPQNVRRQIQHRRAIAGGQRVQKLALVWLQRIAVLPLWIIAQTHEIIGADPQLAGQRFKVLG